MIAEVRTVSEEDSTSMTAIREYSVAIDPTRESAPDTIESLLGAYAACFMPALRVASEQRGVGDLGEIVIETRGDLDGDGKLTDTTFEITTEADLTEAEQSQVVERAFELCKVHAAMRHDLRADVTFVEG